MEWSQFGNEMAFGMKWSQSGTHRRSIVNARCCVQVVNWCFGSTVLTLARFFLLPSSFLAVTFPGLWWAEFHAEKEMGAKLVGLPGSAVAVATMLGEDALSAVLGKKGCMKPAFHCEVMKKTHLT